MSIFKRFAILRPLVLLLAAATALLPGYSALAGTQLKIATVSPEGSYWMTRMREGGHQIEKLTDGRVELKFYGGGVMGNDKKVLRKMRIGQLHGATFTSGGLSERAPNLQLYGLPLLFKSDAEADYVRQYMDEIFIKRMDDADLVSFGLASGGFARLMSSVPLHNLDDLRGKKIWVPEGDALSYAAMEALGLAPVTLPITDVLTGLQTGLIDIIGSSAVGAVVLQWHTKVKYISDLPVSYIYATLVIEKKAFVQLEPRDQLVVRKVMEEIYREFDRTNRTDEVKASDALLKAGIESVAVDQSQIPNWRSLVAEIMHKQADKGVIDAKLLATVEQHLADFRSNQRSAENMP